MHKVGASGDIWRHGCHKRCVPNKRNDRVNRSHWNPRNSCDHPDVSEILPERILKTVGLLVDFLGPLSIPLIPENPAGHVLCFDYKHPESGNEYVVNLSETTTAG